VLLHFPAIAAAVAASGLILASAAAAAPLFRSSTGTASVRLELRNARDALSVSSSGPLAADILAFQHQQLTEATSAIRPLAGAVETIVGSRTVGRVDDGAPGHLVLASRTGFLGHIQVLSGSPSTEGLWLPDRVATLLGARPGEVLDLRLGGRTASARVAGIYRDLASGPLAPFWAPLAPHIHAADPDAAAPPPLVLTSSEELLDLTTRLEDSGRYGWSFGLTTSARTSLTIAEAEALAGQIRSLESRLGDPATQAGSALGQPTVSTPLPGAVGRAVAAQSTIAGPVETLAIAGELVALVGMLAAGVYGVRRRRTEIRMLDAAGIPWWQLAVRGATESALPALMGATIGWAGTEELVRLLGPSSVIEATAIREAVIGSGIALVIAIVVVGIVGAFAARAEVTDANSPRGRAFRAGTVWEIPVLVLAGASLYEIVTRGAAPIASAGGSIDLDRLLLLFPILFVAGTGGLAVRGLARVLARMRGSGDRWPMPLYIASRRLSAAPRVALLLVTASCLAIGVLTYAATVASSIRTTTLDKVMISVGSDVSARTPGPIVGPPPGSGFRVTSVLEIPYANLTPSPGTATVIGVDPRTFAGTAFWDDRFSSRSIAELMASLSVGSGGALPAIIVNGSASPTADITLAGYPLSLRVVGTSSAFPGEQPGMNLVVPADGLRETLESHGASFRSLNVSYEAWAAGNGARAAAYFAANGAQPNTIEFARDQLDRPGFHALNWTFAFMEVLGIMTAFVALIGLLLYLQARQRSREITYALSRRMGLSSSAHGGAVAIELAGLLLAAMVVGGVFALGSVALVYRRLDPVPNLPPGPLLQLPWWLFGEIALAAIVCAWAGAWFVQRRAARADVGAVMRFAD
jgi:putative ABC transport system permease protein